MIRRNKDSKFVIYQVLYIFVITVLAIKGADLDLGEVISKDEAVKTTVRDSLMTVIDSLNAMGLKFNLKIDQNVEVENQELKKKIEAMNQSMASLSQKLKDISPPVRQDIAVRNEEPEPAQPRKDDIPMQSPLSEGQIFIQNTWNLAKNNSNVPVQVLDPSGRMLLAQVPAGQQVRFDLGSQNEVLLKYGNREERIKVNPNKPPEIKIEGASTRMNSRDIYVQDLQKSTVFKVTVLDERPEQLSINYNGPVSVSGPFKDSKGNLIYNVSLRIASNEQKFDEWMDKVKPLKEAGGRYKVNFFFTAVDKVTKDKVQVGDSFYFTDFAR